MSDPSPYHPAMSQDLARHVFNELDWSSGVDAHAVHIADLDDEVVMLIPGWGCPAREIAIQVDQALAVGRTVELIVLAEIAVTLSLMWQALALIYPGRLRVVSASTSGWTSRAEAGEIVIITAKDAYFSERPWARLLGDCAATPKDCEAFYSSDSAVTTAA